MSAKGDHYKNAAAERFVATLEFELIRKRDWHTLAEARRAISQCLEIVQPETAAFHSRSDLLTHPAAEFGLRERVLSGLWADHQRGAMDHSRELGPILMLLQWSRAHGTGA